MTKKLKYNMNYAMEIKRIICEAEGEKYKKGELNFIKMTGSNGKDIVGFGPHLLLFQCDFTKT